MNHSIVPYELIHSISKVIHFHSVFLLRTHKYRLYATETLDIVIAGILIKNSFFKHFYINCFEWNEIRFNVGVNTPTNRGEVPVQNCLIFFSVNISVWSDQSIQNSWTRAKKLI